MKVKMLQFAQCVYPEDALEIINNTVNSAIKYYESKDAEKMLCAIKSLKEKCEFFLKDFEEEEEI